MEKNSKIILDELLQEAQDQSKEINKEMLTECILEGISTCFRMGKELTKQNVKLCVVAHYSLRQSLNQ